MGKKRGGIGSTITGGILSLVMIGIVLAGLQLSGVASVDNAFSLAKEKAAKYVECIPAGNCGIASIIDDIEEIDIGIGQGGSSGNSSSTGGSSGGNSDGNNSNSGSAGAGSGGGGNTGGADGGSNGADNGLVDSDTKGYRGPSSGEPFVNGSGMITKEKAEEHLSNLTKVDDKVDDEKKVGYSRKEWKHWSSVEGKSSCWNTRSEILYRDAVPGSVKLVDKKKQATESYDSACAIGIPTDGKVETKGSGEWIGPYSGKKVNDPRDIDIDHIIPLSNAARNGGQDWTLEQKEKFANDPDNLLATTAKENRSKGDKGPGKYMPPSRNYHCQYSKTYVSLANKYNLTITESDHKALEKALSSCKK